MRRTTTLIELTGSTSQSLLEKKEYNADSHFRWVSIRKFIYLAYTFSSASLNFDIFSKVLDDQVRIFDFVLLEVTIGMTYMCMDLFIKQYTRRMDSNNTLNPLLRGITFGALLQTALWTLIHASDLADAMRFLAASLHAVPSWSQCQKGGFNVSCVPSKDIILRCRDHHITKLNITSAHVNYLRSFYYLDRSVFTTRFFVMALVWICNFLLATVTDSTLLKLFKLAFVWRTLSTTFTMVFILFSGKYYISAALTQILDVTAPNSYTSSVDRITYTFGIGLLGVYDFGTMSPYTMIDNAVVIFTVLFTAVAFARSLIVRILYLVLTKCVEVEFAITPHYLVFALLPLSTEFLHAQKLYVFYIYLNMMVALIAYIVLLTLTMSKLLHNEFRSVKNIYIVGILCFLGFSFSLLVTISLTTSAMIDGITYGVNVIVLYLGGFKMAIVMWVYGVQRFSTDIHFWLGFKPTKFWTICWILQPVALLLFLIKKIYNLSQMTDLTQAITAIVWIILSLFIVAIIHIKTIAKFLLRNNFVGAFISSLKYGPPEPEERRRRREYDESVHHRKCTHNCVILDNYFECNHLPLIYKSKSKTSLSGSESSLTNIYEAGPSTDHRASSTLDLLRRV